MGAIPIGSIYMISKTIQLLKTRSRRLVVPTALTGALHPLVDQSISFDAGLKLFAASWLVIHTGILIESENETR